MWLIALSCVNAKPASATKAQICLKIDRHQRWSWKETTEIWILGFHFTWKKCWCSLGNLKKYVTIRKTSQSRSSRKLCFLEIRRCLYRSLFKPCFSLLLVTTSYQWALGQSHLLMTLLKWNEITHFKFAWGVCVCIYIYIILKFLQCYIMRF